VRRFLEAGWRASWQTTQVQPSVGTPIEVPLPKNVRVAFMRFALKAFGASREPYPSG
jgi:hypothetical protein